MDFVTASGLTRLIGLALRGAGGTPVSLHIPRCRSVHTFGMRYALDLIWLDELNRIVRLDRAVPPSRIRSCREASSVVERPSR